MWIAPTGEALREIIRTPAEALTLVTAGMLAVCLEFAWPGRYVLGAVGAGMCLLGISTLAAFPMTTEGTALLLLAAAGFVVHARARLCCLPLLAAATLLVCGLRVLTVPPLGAGVALALALPVSLTVGLLLDIARRSRAAKRQLINTGLDVTRDFPTQ